MRRITYVVLSALLVFTTLAAVPFGTVSATPPANGPEAVSVNNAGELSNKGSSVFGISDNGRYVAFSSYATNLGTQATTQQLALYVHDRQTGTTTLADVGDNEVQESRDPAGYAMSDDGRHVIFSTFARGLSANPSQEPGFPDWGAQVYVRNLDAGTTRWVSISETGEPLYNSQQVRISGDGQVVLIASQGAGSQYQLYVRDMATSQTTRVPYEQVNPNISQIGQRGDIHLSYDGRFVAYGYSDNSPGRSMAVYDRIANTTAVINNLQLVANRSVVDMSDDGRYVVIFDGTGELPHPRSLTRYDVITGQAVLIADYVSQQPSISSDGQTIAYVKYDAVANLEQVYIQNIATGLVYRASVTNTGEPALEGTWGSPYLADDGTVAFAGQITNFGPYVTEPVQSWVEVLPQVYVASAIPDMAPPVAANATATPSSVDEGSNATLTATVTTGRAGVSRVEYFVGSDPGAGSGTQMTKNAAVWQASVGASLSPGTHTVSVRAQSGTGVWSNIDTATLTVVPLDGTPPEVTHTLNSTPNALGWHTNDVTITWAATDPAPSSGTPTTPAPTLANQEGIHTYTSDQSCDPANNCATGSVSLKIDKTAPTISYVVTPTPNAAGWNKANATVTFTCSDATSGMATCPAPVTVSTETSGQVVTGTATDNAGNTATVTGTVKLDKTLPTVSNLSVTPGAIFMAGTLTISATAADARSGVAQAEYYLDTDPGQGNGTPMTYNAGNGQVTATRSIANGSLGFGQHSINVRVKDAAGNWSAVVSRNFMYIGF